MVIDLWDPDYGFVIARFLRKETGRSAPSDERPQAGELRPASRAVFVAGGAVVPRPHSFLAFLQSLSSDSVSHSEDIGLSCSSMTVGIYLTFLHKLSFPARKRKQLGKAGCASV